VSVFNGKTWKNFDQVTGPLGGHVVAIAVSPKSGDIVMASEVGLARYRPKTDDWKYYVAPPGLSLSNATSLTFDRTGNLLVGLEADGIAIGDASSDFERWTHLTGPDCFSGDLTGTGLPSRQINCLLTTSKGIIYAGTKDGLAISADGGTDWRFIAGADRTAKFAGLYANKKFTPTLCGFQLMLQDSDGSAINNGHFVWVDASKPPQDEYGVHISCSGGGPRSVTHDIDLSHAELPGPMSLYQSERQGDCTYTLSGLDPRRRFVLRLQFAEFDYNGPGQRKFNQRDAGPFVSRRRLGKSLVTRSLLRFRFSES